MQSAPKARPRTLAAWSYQSDLIRWLAGWILSDDVLIESPTGSGKTLIGSTIMAMNVGRGRSFTHGIIAAPQCTIEAGFIPDSPQVVKVEMAGGPRRVRIDPKRVRRAGEGGASVRSVLRYLARANPGYVLTCTHAALVAVMKRHTGVLAKALLFLDESHHAEADRLKVALDAWSDRGGRLIYASATPYRTDGRKPIRAGMKVYRRTIPEQMEDGRYAPRTIEHHFVAIGRPGDEVTRREFTGKVISPHLHVQDEIIAQMVADWIKLGYPKVVIRVPILVGGSSNFVERLIAAFRAVKRFESSPTRVLDATGTATVDRRRVIAALGADRLRSYQDSEIDVIVGIQRVLEGMDWPHCSTVFSVGMPGSLQMIVQLLGRALRLKSDDHNSDHRDRAMIRFFVPCAGGTLKNLSRDHSAHALVTAIYLSDWQAGESLLLTRIVRRAFRDNSKAIGDESAKPDPRPEAPYHPEVDLSPKTQAEVKAVMAAAAEEHGANLTPGLLVDAALKQFPDLDRPSLDTMAVTILLSDERTGQAAQEDLAKRIKKLRPARIIPKRKVALVFAEVLSQFRDETLCPNRSLQAVGVQVHKLTGEGMREWVRRIRFDFLPDLDRVIGVALAEFDTTGRWPSQKHRTVALGIGLPWKILFQGYINRYGISLSKELDRRFPDIRPTSDRTSRSFAFSLDDIVRLAHSEWEDTGRWPAQADAHQAGNTNYTWCALNGILVRKYKTNLTVILNEQYPQFRPQPKRSYATFRLSPDDIAQLAFNEFRETKRWPTKSDTAKAGDTGRSWLSIFKACWVVHKIRVNQLLDERFRDLRCRPARLYGFDLTQEDIAKIALAEFHATGRWPATNDKHDAGTTGMSWNAVAIASSKAYDLTFAKFLDARFPELRGKKPPA